MGAVIVREGVLFGCCNFFFCMHLYLGWWYLAVFWTAFPRLLSQGCCIFFPVSCYWFVAFVPPYRCVLEGCLLVVVSIVFVGVLSPLLFLEVWCAVVGGSPVSIGG